MKTRTSITILPILIRTSITILPILIRTITPIRIRTPLTLRYNLNFFGWNLKKNWRELRPATKNKRSTLFDVPWAVSPGAGSAAENYLSSRWTNRIFTFEIRCCIDRLKSQPAVFIQTSSSIPAFPCCKSTERRFLVLGSIGGQCRINYEHCGKSVSESSHRLHIKCPV